MSSKIRQNAICLTKKHLLLVVIILGIISFISLSSIALNTNKSLSSKAATNDIVTQQQTAPCTKPQVLCGNKDQFACGEGNVYCCHAGLSLGADNKCTSSSNSSPPIVNSPQPITTISSVPEGRPPEIGEEGYFCRKEGCVCRNIQDCDGPNTCIRWEFSDGSTRCGTPWITLDAQSLSHSFYAQNNFKITARHNVVDMNVEYLYSCNWKTDADYKKGTGKINDKISFDVTSQELCSNKLGTYTFAIKINTGSSEKPVWIEKKQVYSIIENNPKVCYFPKERGMISFDPGSCIFSNGIYHQCSGEMREGKMQYYIVPPSKCESFVNSYGCSLRIADPPSYITIFRDECYEQNGQYQLCDYNFTTNKFELKRGEKTYCQYHLHK